MHQTFEIVLQLTFGTLTTIQQALKKRCFLCIVTCLIVREVLHDHAKVVSLLLNADGQKFQFSKTKMSQNSASNTSREANKDPYAD